MEFAASRVTNGAQHKFLNKKTAESSVFVVPNDNIYTSKHTTLWGVLPK